MTIANTGGTDGPAKALLNGPAPAGVAAYPVTSGGSGITSATASVSGGGCVGTVPGKVHIGYPTAMDGRTITVVNKSGVGQTLVNGAAIQLAGARDVSLSNGSTITFRVADGGVWHETARALK
jgi:hypothetical protein